MTEKEKMLGDHMTVRTPCCWRTLARSQAFAVTRYNATPLTDTAPFVLLDLPARFAGRECLDHPLLFFVDRREYSFGAVSRSI